MTDEPITPAMTPEQWADRRFVPASCPNMIIHDDSDGIEIVIADRDAVHAKYKFDYWSPNDTHALAALCLYGQPFGFTQTDVAELREIATEYDFHAEEYGQRLRSIADRIAALLPPQP